MKSLSLSFEEESQVAIIIFTCNVDVLSLSHLEAE